MTWAFQPLMPAAAQEQSGGAETLLDAERGSFGLSGQAVTFMLVFNAEAGTVTITGFNVLDPNAGAGQSSGPSAGAMPSGGRNDAPRFSRTRWRKR